MLNLTIFDAKPVMFFDNAKRIFEYVHVLEGPHFIWVRLRYAEDGETVESFAVSQQVRINNKVHDIIRFDASLREGVNVHKMFLKGSPKRFLNKPATWETVHECFETISNNWQWFFSQYKEKKGL